jgi:hypothetical protein
VPLFGREFKVPLAKEIFLGLPDQAANARLQFSGASIDSAAQAAVVDQTFRLTSVNFAQMLTGVANPCTVALTMTPSTGIFTGTFLLRDGTQPRNGAFNGIVVPGEPTAYGLFTLPQLPATPLPPTVALTTPIEAGLVELRAAP